MEIYQLTLPHNLSHYNRRHKKKAKKKLGIVSGELFFFIFIFIFIFFYERKKMHVASQKDRNKKKVDNIFLGYFENE